MVEFTIPGEPVAQGRPRAGKTRYGKTIMYDPQNSRDYKQFVGLVARQHAPKTKLEGALSVRMKIYRQIPKSTTKKNRALFLAGIKRPVVKPDIDNFTKGVLDALNHIIYTDDSQVVDLNASKYYSDNPRVELEIKEIDIYEGEVKTS
ncbi:MAG TPA: RusA family crossover junction endodeoxyribonuclease [Atopostipes sp.]|nr:RusA family crossover junction endodeoxyribonuclease [Atopostipes sp.]